MDLLPLEDDRWASYLDAYGEVPEGLVDWLDDLLAGDFLDEHWDFLWDDLHNQGDIGEASYAVIPYLAIYAKEFRRFEWHLFSFAAVVELARLDNENPDLPEELENSYFKALDIMADMAALDTQDWDEDQTSGMAACIALSKNQPLFARAYLEMTTKESALDFLQNETGWEPGEEELE